MISVTRRLILSVLLTEAAAGLALITAIAFHEYHLQLSAFDITLRSSAESLLGAVQDAEDEADNVVLDSGALHLAHKAVYRVQEDDGRILATVGSPPMLQQNSREPAFFDRNIGGKTYRLVVLHGVRTIDPGRADGGVVHHITITYGMPFGRVWHEVVEAIRFSVLAVAVLLTTTALVMIFVTRRVLRPLHDLASKAEQVSSANWTFDAPASAARTKELKPLADALGAALARLELSFTQQKRFTSDAAHELKTDVAIIKSSLQLLSMKPRTNEEYRLGLQKALGDIERLENTVRTMLTLARLEQPSAGPPSFSSLAQAAEESLSLCTPYAEMRSITLSSDLAVDSLVAIESRDAVLLCSNLLMNAIQHSTEGQTVNITLARQAQTVQLRVVDNGEGIPAEDLPFLLEAFYRGDPSRSRKSGGSGLGLAICKAICDRPNGSIEIQSELRKGTTVTVSLPWRDTSDEATAR